MIKKIGRAILINSLWYLLGRKNFVKFARFLNNESRLDVENNPKTNGEINVQMCILKILPNDRPVSIFDVGANVGSWTYSLIELSKKFFVKLSIHAFEPCSSTYNTLTRNLQIWDLEKQVKANNIALSSSVGKHCFYSIGTNAGRNSFYPINDNEIQSVEDVEIETIDNYCSKNNLSHIFFIKIDTEGHDLDVIYGCKGLLLNGAIDIIQFEYNHRWINARHFLRDAFEYFKRFDFVIGKITPRGIEFYTAWDIELESFREANYLAMKKSFMNNFPQISWWNYPKK
jgi:FkbM family methyltransferase